MSRTSVAVLLAVTLIAIALVRPPSASIRISTHDAADLAPHRLEAAVDLGLMALSLIITWSERRLR